MLRCATRRGASELNHDDPSSFSPPAAFGPFRVLHQIGSGVLGPVFRTYEPERDRLIAVKAFRIDLLPEQAALLATELQNIVDAGLTHPAIVQPVAAGMEGHLPYLAQEYVAAESLDIAMKHYAPAAPARVLPFLRQIAGALDAAAAMGVLHGGLHPRDIFLTTDEARTTGFGIVQAIENIGFRAPTRRPYTAPERVNGDEWGISADVFALGAIAHELLTARRPAGPGDQDGSFSADVPAEQRPLIRDVLARALAEDPGSRFDSATALVDALEAASEGRRVGPAAAPSLFDAAGEPEPDVDETPVPADTPVETIDDVEDTDDVDDVDDVEDEEDIEDTDDVEEPEPVEPVEPENPGTEPDVWPPPGFATSDLDITTEKEADEALGDFDLDLNPAPVVAAPIEPSPDEEAEALEAAEAFEYDTAVEEDEDQPHDEPAAIPAIPMPPRAAAPAAAPSTRVEGWRPSAGVAVSSPAAESRGPLRTILGIAAGLALGLLLGYVLFGRDEVIAPAPDQARELGGAPVPQTPATEVPLASPSTTPNAPATPATDSQPAAPTSGRVLVRSTPTNAMVVIDGVWSGRTPHTKRDLSFGEHTVRVVLEGYEPLNRRVTLTPDNAAREMNFELQRSGGRRGAETQPREAAAPQREGGAPPAGTPAPAANASLSISSRPAGARVMVNGRFVGTTPLKLAGVTPGAHQVRIVLEGYRPWSTTLRVAANQEARVAAPLVPR